VFRSDDNGTVQGLVGAGMAAALVPLLAADGADDAVTLLDIEGGVPDRRIAIAWHRDRTLSPAARSFIALAQQLCSELGAPVIREAVGG
jgi:DNA-binding transcriptional LysR family regulator